MSYRIRPARPADARAIAGLVEPYALRRILISKELINYFEDIQEFLVAELEPEGDQTDANAVRPEIIGCGALHVMWDDIGEIRTLAVAKEHLHKGVGARLLTSLLARARQLELERVFCLTFEVDFFARHGFKVISGTPVGQDVYAEMLRSHDDGVKEFLDLAAYKPNTLGNTRMLRDLTEA